MRPLYFCLALATTVVACGPEPVEQSEAQSVPTPAAAALAAMPQVIARELPRGTEARLQAISVVSPELVWVSGLDGTWGRTEDGGGTWVFDRIAGAEELQLRDVHGVGRDVAYALSAGGGSASRIFKTHDAGATWELQWTMEESEGFLDCFDFRDSARGLVYGDSIGGDLFLLRTDDGASWRRLDSASLPPAEGKEGGFAASGTCVRLVGDEIWIGTGAGERPRILRSRDGGATWSAVPLPTVAGEAAGVMSVVVGRGGFAGAFGGDLEQSDARTANVAWTEDGGESWSLGEPPSFLGAIYGADLWEADGGRSVVAVGPNGAELSVGSVDRWIPLSRDEYWAVAFLDETTFLAVGPEGRITRFDF